MRASIIIPVYNRREDLRECLQAIPVSTLAACDSEIIVVDDASTDGAGDMIRAEFPHVRLIETCGNVGPGSARNAGAGIARGDLLIFLDSDALPEPQWLQEMVDHDDGHTILAGRIEDFATGETQYGPRRSTFIGKSLPCSAVAVNMGPSGNLAVPQSCFHALHGFWDEISFAFEDSFFSFRAKKHGYGFRYLEKATVRHKGSVKRSGEAIRITEHNGVYAMLAFYRGSWWKQAAFTVANACWLALRMIAWTLSGRYGDARLLASGWASAYRRYRASRAKDIPLS